MTTNEQEVLELAKKCGAKVVYEGAQHTIFFESQLDLSAYTSAIEEKYQAQNVELQKQIAMLNTLLDRFEYNEYGPKRFPSEEEVNSAVNATQATADAFIADIEAGAREEDAKRIERAGQHISWHHAAKDWPTDARTAIEIFSANMAAELRNQQPEQPRKPCSCDGWCDGFCLEKEGKRK